jgi:hypothetical protein
MQFLSHKIEADFVALYFIIMPHQYDKSGR